MLKQGPGPDSELAYKEMKAKNVIGLSLITLAATTVIYYLLTFKQILLSDKINRRLSFSPSYCLGLSGDTNIDLPAIMDQFYDDFEVEQNRAKINIIKSQYGSIISNIAFLTNLPDSLILAFIFVESSGIVNSKNGNGIGLMQIGVNSATDIVYNEYKNGRLFQEEISILRSYLNERMDQIFSMRSPGITLYITAEDLYNPELNILIGAIYLGQLIDESFEADKLRLDKVIIRYNTGYFSFQRGRKLIGDIATILNIVNPITQAYITKMIGKNGVLETIESENCSG